MALSGWDSTKKLKLTIDSSNVDEDLTNFPVLVTLSSGTGQTSFDTTRIFDELTTVTGTRKIAITDSNDNQCYVEIERWDWENEEANLWVKIPTIASGTDTALTLYYDSAHDDNIHYVGGVGDLDYQMVVDIGEEGVYDTDHARAPYVIKESASSYKMWYGGYDGTNWRGMYAISENGTTWSGHSMIIDIGDEGTYDTTHVLAPYVIKESDTSYKMWYSGHDGANWRVIYTISENGTTWSGHSMVMNYNVEGTYDTSGAFGPSVIKESDTSYKMWYIGYDGADYRIMYATSTNGTSWSNHQLVLNYNTEGTYDTDDIFYPNVISDSGGYRMWYDGYDGINNRILYSPYWSTNVWDKNFVGVWHMNQDPNGDVADAIKDSTLHVNHGTPGGTMLTEDLVDSQVGKGIDFDGTDDYIDVDNGASLSFGAPADTFTLESIVKTSDSTARIVGRSRQIDTHMPYQLRLAGGYTKFARWNQPGGEDAFTDTNIIVNDNVFHYVAFKNINASDHRIFVDGIDRKDDTTTWTYDNTTTQKTFIGRWQNSSYGDAWFTGIIDEIRISNIDRSNAWLKATYYSNWNDFVTFSESVVSVVAVFTFSNPIPVDTTVYGTTQNLYLTVTVSGGQPSYIYDATFYDALDDGIIGSTVSGTSSGQAINGLMTTSSGIDYSWYVTAVSSGVEDTSSIYTFTNRFLCEGYVEVSDVPASGIPVRLYLRSTGEYVGGTTSAGVSGTFEIETTHNAYHYAVALYDYSTTNALIEDWLIPSN